jgi:hypothetical protein
MPDFFGNDPAAISHGVNNRKKLLNALNKLPEDHPIKALLGKEINNYQDSAVPAQSMGPGSPIGDYRSDVPPVHNPIVTHPNWNQHVGNTIHNLGTGSGGYQGSSAVPPVLPKGPNGGLGGLVNNFRGAMTTAAPIAGAAFAGSKIIQHGVDTMSAAHLFHSAGAKDFINDETKVLTDFADKTLNPMGINVAGGAAVSILKESFAVLQSIDKGVDSMAKEVRPFAPETIQQDILNQISQLQQNIKLGEELDPLLAEYSASRNEFQLAWNEVRAEILQDLVPLAIDFMKTVKPLLPLIEMHVKGMVVGIQMLTEAAKMMPFGIGATLTALEVIANNTKPDQTAHLDNQVLNNINKFFNLNQPLNNAQKPKKVI